MGEREQACPFCGADPSSSAPGTVRRISRRELTRAAVFTGAVLLVTACTGADDSDGDTTSGGGDGTGGGEDEDDTLLTDGDGNGDLGDGDPEEEQWHRRQRGCGDPNDVSCMAMPYGGPPTPESFV